MAEQVQDEKPVQTETRRLFPPLRKVSPDDLFEISVTGIASIIIILIALTAFVLVQGSLPVFRRFGTGFLTGVNWNPVLGKESFGALPFILGTLVTSAIALIVGVPISLGIAVFLSEMATPAIRTPLSQVIELLAAVPSVIYGFWGLFVFRFWIADWIEKPIASILGFVPTFQGPLLGLDVLTAGLILAIMIIPTISAISKEVMLSVPATQREAAYSLGATKWEAVRIGVLSYARSGIFGAIIIGLGRAVGETMAVTMVIGNANVIPVSLFQSGQTMSSAIVSQFSEADFGTLQFSALVGVGLVLLMFAIIINIFAQVMVWKIFRIRGGSVE